MPQECLAKCCLCEVDESALRGSHAPNHWLICMKTFIHFSVEVMREDVKAEETSSLKDPGIIFAVKVLFCLHLYHMSAMSFSSNAFILLGRQNLFFSDGFLSVWQLNLGKRHFAMWRIMLTFTAEIFSLWNVSKLGLLVVLIELSITSCYLCFRSLHSRVATICQLPIHLITDFIIFRRNVKRVL